MKINKIILTILILSIVTLVFSGCGGGGSVIPPFSEPIPTIIPETTKVVEEETIQEIASITEDQSTIIFKTSTPQLEELIPGDIIVMGVTEHTPEGLLRKVKNITKGGKGSSEIVVETEFASLEEAIEQGEFYFNEALKAEDAKEPVCYVKGIEFIRDKFSKIQLLEFTYNINAIIYDEDNNPNTEEDNITLTGQISFDYNVLLSGKIIFFQLKELNFQNIVEVEKNLGVTVGGSVELFSYEKVLFTQDLGIKVISIGCCFPVVLHPKINISANVDGEIFAELTAEVTDTDIYTAGIQFDNGSWQPISSHENYFSPPSLLLSTGGSVTFGVGPELECKVDGVVGPYCKTTLYGKVIADIYENPWWKIYVGIIAKAGVKIEIFSKVFASADLTVLDLEKIIDQADGPVEENSTYALRDIGPAGGYIFYDKGYYSSGWRYLEAAPLSTEWTEKQWGSCGDFYLTGCTLIGGTGKDIGTGQSNTTIIVTWLNSHGEIDCAAQLCDALVYGGYSDWFLPSKDELNLVFANLEVYGVGGFADDYYWSSSESNADFVWCPSPSTVAISVAGFKDNYTRVRAVRAF